MQALAQVWVPRLAQPGPVLGTNPLHRSLRSQAVSDGVLKTAIPPTVVGEHAVGFQHLIAGLYKAVLALQHEVDLRLQL